MKVHFIPVSHNAKTGPIPVAITERESCWPGCALYENGCYAKAGALAVRWDRVSHGTAGSSWSSSAPKSRHFGPVAWPPCNSPPVQTAKGPMG